MPRSDGYDPAEEFAHIAYQSGYFDAIHAEQEEHVNAQRDLQNAVVEASHQPGIASFWDDAGWTEHPDGMIPADEDDAEYVIEVEDDPRDGFAEEWE